MAADCRKTGRLESGATCAASEPARALLGCAAALACCEPVHMKTGDEMEGALRKLYNPQARNRHAGQRPSSANEEVKEELVKQFCLTIVSRALGPSPSAGRACQLKGTTPPR